MLGTMFGRAPKAVCWQRVQSDPLVVLAASSVEPVGPRCTNPIRTKMLGTEGTNLDGNGVCLSHQALSQPAAFPVAYFPQRRRAGRLVALCSHCALESCWQLHSRAVWLAIPPQSPSVSSCRYLWGRSDSPETSLKFPPGG